MENETGPSSRENNELGPAPSLAEQPKGPLVGSVQLCPPYGIFVPSSRSTSTESAPFE